MNDDDDDVNKYVKLDFQLYQTNEAMKEISLSLALLP